MNNKNMVEFILNAHSSIKLKKELAKKLGVSPRFLRYFVRGERKSKRIDKKLRKIIGGLKGSKTLIVYMLEIYPNEFIGDYSFLYGKHKLHEFLSKMEGKTMDGGLIDYKVYSPHYTFKEKDITLFMEKIKTLEYNGYVVVNKMDFIIGLTRLIK